MVMDSNGGDTVAMGVKCADSLVTKSLDNIVGNLWQQRQESSGSSAGNQSPRNDDLSEADPGSPARLSVRDSATPEQDYSGKNDSGGGGGGGVRVKDPRDLIKDESKDEKDPRSFLAQLPHMVGLEALQKQHRDFLNSPSFLQGIRNPGGLFPPIPHTVAGTMPTGLPPNLMFPTSMNRPPSQPPTPSSQRSTSPPIGHQPAQTFGGSQQNWSFEEQFKQLYEIDDNPKRKEFLDELFTFMQKRGTPINRLPIMAKQVLDLYELFNLVIARGGLVEVINKKLWQEIIKGLGLPSSITSAAFTLRTQYTKYLYPLECTKKNFSHPTDLQAAIEGNKREGRRGSYGAYSDLIPSSAGHLSPISPMSALVSGHHHSLPRQQFNANGGPHMGGMDSRSPPILHNGHHNSKSASDSIALEMTRLALFKMYNGGGQLPVSLPNLPQFAPDMFSSPEKALAERQRVFEEAVRREELRAREEDRLRTEEDKENTESDRSARDRSRVRGREVMERCQEEEEEEDRDVSSSPPPNKKANINVDESEEDPEESEENLVIAEKKSRHQSQDHREESRERSPAPLEALSTSNLTLPGANIKITNRGDSTSGDSSLVVSLEINGVSYQGVLFAQIKPKDHNNHSSSPHRHSSKDRNHSSQSGKSSAISDASDDHSSLGVGGVGVAAASHPRHHPAPHPHPHLHHTQRHRHSSSSPTH